MSQWSPPPTSKWKTVPNMPGVYVLPSEVVTKAFENLSEEARERVRTFGDLLKEKMIAVAKAERSVVTRK